MFAALSWWEEEQDNNTTKQNNGFSTSLQKSGNTELLNTHFPHHRVISTRLYITQWQSTYLAIRGSQDKFPATPVTRCLSGR